MKKVLFLLLIAIGLTSCSTVVSFPQFTTTTVVDYSEFAKKGIFVTESNSVNFDYKPLGSVVSVTQGAWSTVASYKIDADKAFSEIASKVKEIGGNGLINFDLIVSSTGQNSLMTVSGMAIRTDEPIIVAEELPVIAKPKTDIHIDGVHCFIFKRFQSGVAVMTEAVLNVEQIKRALKEFVISNIEYQFFLPNTKTPYMAVTDNGYIIDYATNEFIPLK